MAAEREDARNRRYKRLELGLLIATILVAALGISLSALFARKADIRAEDAAKQAQARYDVQLDAALWTTREPSPETEFTLEFGEFGLLQKATVFRLQAVGEAGPSTVGFTWLVITNRTTEGCLKNVKLTELLTDAETLQIDDPGTAMLEVRFVPHELPLTTRRPFCPADSILIPIATVDSPSRQAVSGCDVSVAVSATLAFDAPLSDQSAFSLQTQECTAQFVPLRIPIPIPESRN